MLEGVSSRLFFFFFYAFIGMPLVSFMIKYTYNAPKVHGIANINMDPWSPTETIRIGNSLSVANDTNCMITLHIVTPTVRILMTSKEKKWYKKNKIKSYKVSFFEHRNFTNHTFNGNCSIIPRNIKGTTPHEDVKITNKNAVDATQSNSGAL